MRLLFTKFIAFFVMCSFVLGTIPKEVFAGDWVDDYVNSYSYSGPSFYESSSRGYVNMGNISVRWGDSTMDPLATLSPPSVKAGCGGIDAFMGSFSYLDFGRLVQKLKKVGVGTVAAFAFKIALQVLCSPCSAVLDGLEAISNGLNALQFGDCMSSKEVQARIGSAMNSFSTAVGKFGQAAAEFQNMDYKDTWDKAKSTAADFFTGFTDFNSDCNTMMKSFFTEGSLLHKALAESKGYGTLGNDKLEGVIRGLVGDLYIVPLPNAALTGPSTGGTPVKVLKTAACAENGDSGYINHLVNGDYYYKPRPTSSSNTNPACVKANSSGTYEGISYSGGLSGLCRTMMKRIAFATKPVQLGGTGSGFGAAEKRFLRESPIPISMIIRLNWMTSVNLENSNINTGMNTGNLWDVSDTQLEPWINKLAFLMAYEALSVIMDEATTALLTAETNLRNALNTGSDTKPSWLQTTGSSWNSGRKAGHQKVFDDAQVQLGQAGNTAERNDLYNKRANNAQTYINKITADDTAANAANSGTLETKAQTGNDPKKCNVTDDWEKTVDTLGEFRAELVKKADSFSSERLKERHVIQSTQRDWENIWANMKRKAAENFAGDVSARANAFRASFANQLQGGL